MAKAPAVQFIGLHLERFSSQTCRRHPVYDCSSICCSASCPFQSHSSSCLCGWDDLVPRSTHCYCRSSICCNACCLYKVQQLEKSVHISSADLQCCYCSSISCSACCRYHGQAVSAVSSVHRSASGTIHFIELPQTFSVRLLQHLLHCLMSLPKSQLQLSLRLGRFSS